MGKKRNTQEDPVTTELRAIKRLLILQLLKQGATQGEVAIALDVDQSVVSRLFPARKISKVKA